MRVYPPIPQAEGIADLVALVDVAGFALLREGGTAGLERVLAALGPTLFVEEVQNRADSRALVSSERALAPHTDHHRARRIAWICHRQAESGGESLVIDGRRALAALSGEQQAALMRVQLIEHSVFPGDAERHPMLSRAPDGRTRLYYSYWLAEGSLPPAEEAAFDAFAAAVCAAEQHRSRLCPGDILVVDNHRALHGRTAITGGSRHLTRYWLAERPSDRG